jgi:hypothetical protein
MNWVEEAIQSKEAKNKERTRKQINEKCNNISSAYEIKLQLTTQPSFKNYKRTRSGNPGPPSFS